MDRQSAAETMQPSDSNTCECTAVSYSETITSTTLSQQSEKQTPEHKDSKPSTSDENVDDTEEIIAVGDREEEVMDDDDDNDNDDDDDDDDNQSDQSDVSSGVFRLIQTARNLTRGSNTILDLDSRSCIDDKSLVDEETERPKSAEQHVPCSEGQSPIENVSEMRNALFMDRELDSNKQINLSPTSMHNISAKAAARLGINVMDKDLEPKNKGKSAKSSVRSEKVSIFLS